MSPETSASPPDELQISFHFVVWLWLRRSSPFPSKGEAARVTAMFLNVIVVSHLCWHLIAAFAQCCRSRHIAQKTHLLLIEVINDTGGIVHEQYCYHHLRYVHNNGMEKSVVGYMGEVLEEGLKNTSSFTCDSKFGPRDMGLP